MVKLGGEATQENTSVAERVTGAAFSLGDGDEGAALPIQWFFAMGYDLGCQRSKLMRKNVGASFEH